MRLDFNNKIAIVTGGTRGIGKKIADDLHDLGAMVLITGTHENEIQKLNKEAIINQHRKKYFVLEKFDEIKTIGLFKSSISRTIRYELPHYSLLERDLLVCFTSKSHSRK
jgi:NAD(P)-dependent dehydrogenase (short-subunit alcohol dehydrogenase family)